MATQFCKDMVLASRLVRLRQIKAY